MSLDLIKAILLLVGYLFFGVPASVDHAVSFGVKVSSDGASLEVVYDPVLIYYTERTPQGYCGMAFASFVLINPNYSQMGCLNTEAHEMGHIWQYRSHGLLFVMAYPFAKDYFEGPNPSSGIPPHTKVLNHGLFRFSIPLKSW